LAEVLDKISKRKTCSKHVLSQYFDAFDIPETIIPKTLFIDELKLIQMAKKRGERL
jgi:hypothetical protein